jgi:ferredoxin
MELRAIHTNCSGCGVCRQVCTLENFRELNPAKSLLKIDRALSLAGRLPHSHLRPVRDLRRGVSRGCHPDGRRGLPGRRRACIACMECVEACPRDVMMVHPDREAPVKCTLCGRCAELCPRQALVLVEKKKKKAV